MNHPLDDRLQRYFDDVAGDDRLGDTPVGVVMRRGRRRRARRRTGAMAGTLVVGALGSVVAVQALSGGDDRRSISVGNEPGPTAGDGSETGASQGPAGEPDVLGPSPLVWNDVTIGSAEAVSIGEFALPGGIVGGLIVDPAGGFYALSTAPGRSKTTRAALYHSDDGVTWQQQGSPTGAIAPLSTLAAGDGRLYAVGTQAAAAPVAAERDPGQLVIARSADGGATWQDEPLPIDLGAIRTLDGVRSVNTQASVAASGSTSVIAAVTTALVDYDRFVPGGVDPQALDSYSVPGVVVQYDLHDCSFPVTAPTEPADVDGCHERGGEVGRYTWEELGVPATTIDAALGQLHLLRDTGDGQLEAVAAPALPQRTHVVGVSATYTGDRFVVLVQWQPLDATEWTTRTTAFVSADGSEWSALDAPVQSVGQAGALADGSLVVTGTDPTGAAVIAVLRDGVWQSYPMPSLASAGGVPLGWTQRVAIGPLGVAVYGQVADAAPEHQAEADAQAFTESVATTTTSVVVVSDAGATGTTSEQATGASTVAPTAGAPTVAPVAGKDAGSAGAATTMPYGIGDDGTAYDPASVRSVLLFSPDGVTWSADQLPLPDPTRGGYAGLVVTADHVVVTTLDAGALGGENQPLLGQRAFVGTLAG